MYSASAAAFCRPRWEKIPSARTLRRLGAGRRLPDIVANPVLRHHDRRLPGVPAVDAIVLAGAEMIVLAPLDRPAAQSLGVDLHRFHRGADLGGVGRGAGA